MQNYARMFVLCDKCGGMHYPDNVEFVNIEEDFQGRDLMTFVCPETQETTKSLVYRG